MKQKYFIHDSAIVETKSIGEKTTIWAFNHILKDVLIGKNVNICDHCFIENDVKIDDNVTIKSGVFIWSGITIEKNVFIGPSVSFTNDLFPRSKNRSYKQLKTTLKKGCSIGANSTILPGITIGNYSMIGAGSVVIKNVPDFSLYFGNPAKFSSYICKCGEKINFFNKKHVSCKCGCKYFLNKGKIEEYE